MKCLIEMNRKPKVNPPISIMLKILAPIIRPMIPPKSAERFKTDKLRHFFDESDSKLTYHIKSFLLLPNYCINGFK